jgi:hypothetical protein
VSSDVDEDDLADLSVHAPVTAASPTLPPGDPITATKTTKKRKKAPAKKPAEEHSGAVTTETALSPSTHVSSDVDEDDLADLSVLATAKPLRQTVRYEFVKNATSQHSFYGKYKTKEEFIVGERHGCCVATSRYVQSQCSDR